MKFHGLKWLFLLGALLVGSAVAQGSPYHWGFYVSAGYIHGWNVDDVINVKDETFLDTLEDGRIGDTHKIQNLVGSQSIQGVNASLGVTGAMDINSWLALRSNLSLSYRYRHVDVEEQHERNTLYYENQVLADSEFTAGSKGTYSLALACWQLDMPIVLRFNSPWNFYAEGGLLFSYIAMGRLKVELISLDIKSYAAGIELGAVGVFGKTFAIGDSGRKLDLFSKFTFGLTPLLSDRVLDYVNQEVPLKEWIVEVGVIFWMF